MDMRIQPLEIKILLESNSLKSRIQNLSMEIGRTVRLGPRPRARDPGQRGLVRSLRARAEGCAGHPRRDLIDALMRVSAK